MAERWTRDDEQFGMLLSAAGRDAFPPTPELAGSVRERIQSRKPARCQRIPKLLRARPVAAASVAAVLLIAVSLSVIVSSPNAIADRLGVNGIDISFGALDKSPTPLGSALDLGDHVTLNEAESTVPYPVSVPDYPGIGDPDEVYVGDLGEVQQVSLVYSERNQIPTVQHDVSLLITQFPARFGGAPVSKGMSGETVVEAVTVNDHRGFWLSGEPHTFAYQDASGQFAQEDVRLASHVLVWETEEIVYRIEGALSKDDALAVAESMLED